MLTGLLVLVVVVLGGFKFLIEPQISRYGSLQLEYRTALDKDRANRTAVQQQKAVQEENSGLEPRMSEAVDRFFPELSTDIVTLFFDDMANKAGVSYRSFTVSNPVAAQIGGGEQNSGASLSYPMKQWVDSLEAMDADASASGGASSEASDLPADTVEKVTVTLQLQTMEANTLALIDHIRDSGKTVRVLSVTRSSTDDGREDVGITAECFGVKKLS